MQIVKATEEQITEELVKGLVSKIVHVPTNMHTINNPMENHSETVNVWFAGMVAGYEKAYLNYDYETKEFLKEPVSYFNILLTDGMGYVLSNNGDVEIRVISEEEFNELVKEHKAKQQIITPDKPKLILPDSIN